MNILFIHQNFPGQFKHFAPVLAASPGNTVMAMTLKKTIPYEWNGVKVCPYSADRSSSPNLHPWISDFETKTIRGEACLRAAIKLREQGFYPDVIIAHPGWGESLFVKEVWPNAKLGIYCEYYYNLEGGDVGFDPEFPVEDIEGNAARLRIKNLSNLLHFDTADAAISPTKWQADTYPANFRDRITVIHDGVDTSLLKPDKSASLRVNKTIPLTCNDEIITFVNRNLEPARGYHMFMRALPEILKRRPNARVLIVGGNGVSYSRRPPEGQSWKDIYWNEVKSKISAEDRQRVHFPGRLPYQYFIQLLQLSTVHVYFSYPFVLSWSLLEAMSVGCAIIASDTAPVREVIKHRETGRLVSFFDVLGLVDEICSLLDHSLERVQLGDQARKLVVSDYDLTSVCLPRQLKWLNDLCDS